jgi:hypothetical protein
MQFHTTGIVLAALTVVSAASAQSTQAVEWKVSEGGNGHWYCVVRSDHFMTWSQSQSACLLSGGSLVSIGTQAESEWLYLSLVNRPDVWSFNGPYVVGPWIGARGASGNWRWDDGTAWSFSSWHPGEGPPSPDPREQFAHYFAGVSGAILPSNSWGDYFDVAVTPTFLCEWSADCNNDGIVDYGQILHGELEDLNSNGVPDICETSISSVLPPSVPAQGGSTITIRGNGFPANPTVLIGGVPATNVVRESPSRITATSPAVLPGMASVQVNDFTLADGIYIRPECGSDLDQNGTVDAGDISIILLDFGPCYEPPAALAAPAPTPLANEPAQKPGAAKKE